MKSLSSAFPSADPPRWEVPLLFPVNSRLLTPAEIEINRRQRQRRKDQQKAEKRRKLALLAVADASVVASEAVVSDDAVLDLLWGKSVKVLRRAVRKVNRRLLGAEMINRSLAQHGEGLPVATPRRVLCERNRGLSPRLVGAPAEAKTLIALEAALAATRRMVADYQHPVRVLQFMRQAATCELSLEDCAALLHRFGVLCSPIDEPDLEAVRRAEVFAAKLSDACALYIAMVCEREVAKRRGEWAYFAWSDLAVTLPGLRLPHVLRRSEFLVRVARDAAGEAEYLDLYSTEYLPLCRHPL